MPGGPNSGYGLDACCPSSCGSAANNSRCSLIEIPQDQPSAKMYKDMNHDWPLNSWEIAEPSNGYQLSYIRLLSKFVKNGSNLTPVKKQLPVRNFKIEQSKNSLQIFSDKPLMVSIYSASGKLIVKKQSESGTLKVDLQNIPNGIYIAKISNGSVKESRIIAK